MAIDSGTVKMIRAFNKTAGAPRFLSSMFKSPAENFYNSEKVALDIVREDEAVAVVVHNLRTGYRMNTADQFTAKEFTPPVFKEAVALNAFDLLKRRPGKDPFMDPSFRADAIRETFAKVRKIQNMIRRSNEVQASQIMQTAKLTLANEDGVSVYELDFGGRASHFPDAGTPWANANGTQMLNDIKALCEEVRNNGQRDPKRIIMGDTAFENFIRQDEIKDRFDGRRANLGAIVPMREGVEGGQYRGTLEVGTYKLDIWTYGGRYKDPATGNTIKYVSETSVIVDSVGRLDAAFGGVPNLRDIFGGTPAIPELPRRMSNSAGGMDLHVNAWLTPDGENLIAGVASRPLLIPTDIDSFGCLETAPD